MEVELSDLGVEKGKKAPTMVVPFIGVQLCRFEENLVTGFSCAELEPWNSRKGSELEMKFEKPLGGSVGSNQEPE